MMEKKEVRRMEELKKGVEYCGTLSSGHGVATVLLNSQQFDKLSKAHRGSWSGMGS